MADDKAPLDQPPEVEFVYLGTPFTKILENVVSEGRAVVKRGNLAHLNLAASTSLLSKRQQREANRLHGAFTGGFSAGYFNTVGTKEGWTTSTFISSREQRAEALKQAPESFMDEEDFGEFGIAPKQISLTNTFNTAPMGLTQQQSSNRIDDSQLLSQLLQPLKLTFGAKLYRKQLHKGAKPQNFRTTEESQKVYGCAMPQSVPDLPEDDDEGDKELADFYQIVANVKQQQSHVTNNSKFFGLGYSSLANDNDSNIFGRSDHELSILHAGRNARMEAIGGTRAQPNRKGKSQGISGFAFGTGVGEDDDTDDFNNITNLLGYDDRSQYDFAIGIGGDTVKEEKKAKGSDEVEFQRGKSAKVIRPVYKPPSLPKGWVPMHQARKSNSSSRENNKSEDQHHHLNVLERAAKLDEHYPVSVLIPDSQRSKLHSRHEDKKRSEERHQHRHSERKYVKEEVVEKKPAKGDLFYTRKIETDQVLDWEQQTGSGALRSHLYQPMLAQIQSRFTKGGMVSDTSAEAKSSQAEEAESEQMVAVRMNMFGKLTRTSFDWHPDRLLCKRFNVPHPYPESELVGTIGTGKKREKSSANFAKSSAGLGFSLTQEEVKGKETEVKREIRDEEDFHHRSSHHHTKTTEKENQGHSKGPQHQIDMFEPICPKPDLFAKVFASSDTEEEEHSDEEHSEESEGDEADKIRQSLLARLTSGNKPFKPMTIESQSVDERFATVTVKQEPMVEASATTSAMDAAQPKSNGIQKEEDLLYGPPLPPMEFLEQPAEIDFSQQFGESDERSHKKKRKKSRSASPRHRKKSKERRKERSRSHSRSHKHHKSSSSRR